MKLCLTCNSPLLGKYQKKFCSRSCSISHANRQTPKRARKNKCKRCNTPILSTRQHCSDCWNRGQIDKLNMTKRELLTSDTQQYRIIRSHARTTAKNLGLLSKCGNCPYNLYVETCHIKSIQEFNDNALLKEINHPSNLIGLCRNCHWEFDNGFLQL